MFNTALTTIIDCTARMYVKKVLNVYLKNQDPHGTVITISDKS